MQCWYVSEFGIQKMNRSLHASMGGVDDEPKSINTTSRRHSAHIEADEQPLVVMTKSSEISSLSKNERIQTTLSQDHQQQSDRSEHLQVCLLNRSDILKLCWLRV